MSGPASDSIGIPDGATRRKRRRGDEKEAFRTLLVENARKLLEEQGSEGLSIRVLAQRSGIAPMAFYRYFANKAEVVRSAWSPVVVALEQRVRHRVAGHRAPRTKMKAFLDTFLQHWDEHPNAARTLLFGCGIVPVESAWEALFLEHPAATQLLALGTSLLEELVATGSAPKRPLPVLLATLLSQLLGLVLLTCLAPSARLADPALVRRHAVDQLLDTLAA